MNATANQMGLTGAAALVKNWGWVLAFGIAMMVLGVIALGNTILVTISAVWFFGVLFILGGVAHAIHAFSNRLGKGLLLELLLGVIYIAAGIIMILHPLPAASVLTLFLGFMIMFQGAFRIALAVMHRQYSGWVWILLSGIVSAILGIMIVAGWPQTSLFVIGLFVAIDLIFSGASFVALALVARRLKTAIA